MPKFQQINNPKIKTMNKELNFFAHLDQFGSVNNKTHSLKCNKFNILNNV